MKALVFHKPKDVRYEDAPDPRIQHAQDAIVKVTSTSIGGSDLHVYNGYLHPKGRPVLGRELVGEVVELGPRVTRLKKGDRVLVPSPAACGECFYCRKDLPAHCERGDAGGLGGQAQLARVPFADFGPRVLPEGLEDERALLLTDVVPTGWAAAEWCGLEKGDTVAVFGCGPVGIMAMKAARLMGAERIFAVDLYRYRRDLAARTPGVVPIDPDAADPVETIRRLTSGRGADACIDAVGLEAEQTVTEELRNVLHLTVGTINALKEAIAAARRGGVVSVIGVYAAPPRDFPLDAVFAKGLRLRFGPAPVQPELDGLLELVVSGRLSADELISHRLPLSDGPSAYRIFNDKVDGAMKIVLKPWELGEAPGLFDVSVAEDDQDAPSLRSRS